MSIKNEKFLISTQGCSDMVDITQKVEDTVKSTGIKNALIHIYSPGSTISITTIEYEPGLIRDLPDILDSLIPADKNYYHDETWHDGNGFSHIRASIIGNAVTVPLANGEMELGQWQQIVLMDFDTKPRTRSVIVQILY